MAGNPVIKRIKDTINRNIGKIPFLRSWRFPYEAYIRRKKGNGYILIKDRARIIQSGDKKIRWQFANDWKESVTILDLQPIIVEKPKPLGTGSKWGQAIEVVSDQKGNYAPMEYGLEGVKMLTQAQRDAFMIDAEERTKFTQFNDRVKIMIMAGLFIIMVIAFVFVMYLMLDKLGEIAPAIEKAATALNNVAGQSRSL